MSHRNYVTAYSLLPQTMSSPVSATSPCAFILSIRPSNHLTRCYKRLVVYAVTHLRLEVWHQARTFVKAQDGRGGLKTQMRSQSREKQTSSKVGLYRFILHEKSGFRAKNKAGEDLYFPFPKPRTETNAECSTKTKKILALTPWTWLMMELFSWSHNVCQSLIWNGSLTVSNRAGRPSQSLKNAN